MKISRFTRSLLAVFAVIIGLYPLMYFGTTIRINGLLQTKSPELLHSVLWQTAFYIHISAGGFALLFGWLQFNQQRRSRYLMFHRVLGRCYVVAVGLSSMAGLYIALFASGGFISAMAFGLLALCWLFTDIVAFRTAIQRRIDEHRRWMIINYSLTFAAVTLRIWLLLFFRICQIEFIPAYRISAWMCWIPNLLIASWIIQRQQKHFGPELNLGKRIH